MFARMSNVKPISDTSDTIAPVNSQRQATSIPAHVAVNRAMPVPSTNVGAGPEWGVVNSPIAKNTYNPAISIPDNPSQPPNDPRQNGHTSLLITIIVPFSNLRRSMRVAWQAEFDAGSEALLVRN